MKSKLKKNIFRMLEVFLKKSNNYCKFIILSTGRTGSNLLVSLLRSSNNLVVYGEIFRDADKVGWDLFTAKDSKKSLKLYLTNPVLFLKNIIFSNYRKKIKAVGFKLFYEHINYNRNSKMVDYLKKQTDIKIIHLKRANFLARHLSLRKAFKTNEWVNTGKKDIKMKLEIDDCREGFEFLENMYGKSKEIFKNHQLIEIFYEDLIDDYAKTIKKLSDFLDIDYFQATTHLKKQSEAKLSESIINFTELKQAFKETKWKHFFSETGK